jgi:protein-S-isoprenylcysteine O-methyltransferase Ste14
VQITLLLPVALPPTIPIVQYRFLPEWPLIVGLGLAVQAASFVLAIRARQTLGGNWSARIEIKMEHQLVRSGPYRVLRHPIYTAVLGMAAGTALMIGKVHTLLAVAIIVLAYIRKIRMEEAKLHQAFGAEYDGYREATWGLVPGLF